MEGGLGFGPTLGVGLNAAGREGSREGIVLRDLGGLGEAPCRDRRRRARGLFVVPDQPVAVLEVVRGRFDGFFEGGAAFPGRPAFWKMLAAWVASLP